MRPSSPVIPGKEYPEVVVGKNQELYLPLLGLYVCDGQVLITRWEMSEEEKKEVLENGFVYLHQWTFGGPVQPVLLGTHPENFTPEGSGFYVTPSTAEVLESHFKDK